MALAAGFYLALGLAFPHGLGLGDAHLGGLLALGLGWPTLSTGVLAGWCLAALVLLARRQTRPGDQRWIIALGPWQEPGQSYGRAGGSPSRVNGRGQVKVTMYSRRTRIAEGCYNSFCHDVGCCTATTRSLGASPPSSRQAFTGLLGASRARHRRHRRVDGYTGVIPRVLLRCGAPVTSVRTTGSVVQQPSTGGA